MKIMIIFVTVNRSLNFKNDNKIPKFLPENGKIIIPILFQTPIFRTDGFLPFRRS